MILGTANFGNFYNNSFLDKQTCFVILQGFEYYGGKYVDTSFDYGLSEIIINEYIEFSNSKLKIISKGKFYENNLPVIYLNTHYAYLYRGSKIKENKYQDTIIGQSIYYPHELNPNAKIIQIPISKIFEPYLPIMKLHSKIIGRSLYRLNNAKLKNDYLNYYYDEIVIGVENYEELRENMKKYSFFRGLE